MATIENIKVITRDYHVANRKEHFYIVTFTLENVDPETTRILGYENHCRLYGTLDHNDVNEDGTIKSYVNLARLWEARTIPEAIKRRDDNYKALDFIESHKELFKEV